jgi:hypothetical protein
MEEISRALGVLATMSPMLYEAWVLLTNLAIP